MGRAARRQQREASRAVPCHALVCQPWGHLSPQQCEDQELGRQQRRFDEARRDSGARLSTPCPRGVAPPDQPRPVGGLHAWHPPWDVQLQGPRLLELGHGARCCSAG